MSTMCAKWLLLCLISIHVINVLPWKTCEETFCGEIRKSPKGIDQSYYIDGDITQHRKNAVATLKTDHPNSAPLLELQLSIYNEEIVHVYIDEPGKKKRFRPTVALASDDFSHARLEVRNSNESATVRFKNIKLEVNKNPPTIKMYHNNRFLAEINPSNNFVFKTGISKEIAMAVRIHDVQRAYGIPEHAEHLTLNSTKKDGDPYRHFNVDYGHYLLKSRESLYGSIGVLYGHGVNHSCGVFWLNAAQTWIDVETSENNVDAFFMSESGAVDMFVLIGPTLPEAVKQYSTLTGVAPLPQYFTLGYHQSRYSYMTQEEVLEVSKNLDDHDMPVDVLWLDIEYTNEKMYFTWDPIRFPDPQALIDGLAASKRKLVAIIDPHIKAEEGYVVHDAATKNRYYIKNANGTDFAGSCWPGKSSYLDFLNPEALKYYSSLYSQNHFENPNVHLWNDMNEPAVFDAKDDENTIPASAKHFDGWDHKDVHNVYGLYQTIGTRLGMLKVKPTLRPFILTRSHFAGVQRYAAVWTGDNAASWEYLRMSFPMCLTEALAGVSFCGADVGGFFDVPGEELYQRWYQAGAWLPFYRGHSTITVPRREPYLFNDTVKERVRTALYQRYAHLPVWYTLFYEHETTGEPVIRPITYHYPQEADALDIEDQVLLGTDILAAPVLEESVVKRKVYFPGGDRQIWFNIDNGYKAFKGVGYHLIDVTMDSSPVFYREGSIIPRKDIKRKTSADTHQDPFTLYVCLNEDGKAEGRLYVDDYISFQYNKNKFLYVNFSFEHNILNLTHLKHGSYAEAALVSEIVFINSKKQYVAATSVIKKHTNHLDAIFLKEDNVITMKNFNISLSSPSKIEFFETPL